MKRILMSAIAIFTNKAAFAILGVTLLMIAAAPAWADGCSGAPAACGVTITISGSAGNLSATISGGGEGTAYDGSEDQLVGITNNSSVKVGAIILSAPHQEGDNLFQFETGEANDGACVYFELGNCGPTGYEGPNNTYVGISSDFTTGKVLFKTPLAANGGGTWFSLENAPATVVAIGESQTLTAGVTSIFKFGPGNASLNLAPGSEDDFKVTPLITNGISPTGDNFTVTPVIVNPADFGAASPFQNLKCLPYQDYSVDAANNSTCIEIEVDCTGNDQCQFQNSIQLDYGVYGPGVAATNGLIGGPHLLVHHGKPCPDNGFDTDIFTSYTGASAGDVVTPDPPPIKGGSKTGTSCYVSAFDPTITTGPQLIQPGQTVGFPGFQPLVTNTLTPSCKAQAKPLILPVNCILIPLPVLLSWVQTDDLGNKVTNLHLCKNSTGSGCTAPWVNLSLTALTNTTACKALATASLPSVLNSGLVNLGKGQYAFLWNTLTNPNGLTGCKVLPVLNFSSGAVASPAAFVYAN
jgi:hypothetical protein